MKTKALLLTAMIVTVSFLSCKKTAQQSGIAYQLKTTNRSSAVARMQSGTISWTSGYASAKEIKFEAEDSAGHVEFKSETVQKIDLFASLSSLGNVTVAPGLYYEVEFKLELDTTATDAAFELKGTYNSTPVIFTVSSPFEIKGEQANVTIADEKSYTSVTALNLANLITGITSADLDAAAKDSTGSIVISASSNTSIYNTMLNNLHNSEEEDFHE